MNTRVKGLQYQAADRLTLRVASVAQLFSLGSTRAKSRTSSLNVNAGRITLKVESSRIDPYRVCLVCQSPK